MSKDVPVSNAARNRDSMDEALRRIRGIRQEGRERRDAIVRQAIDGSGEPRETTAEALDRALSGCDEPR